MFLTQIYGTVLGGFINYAVMTSIVTGNKELLADSNGDSSWSGATIQSYNTNASTWALAAYLYKQGAIYSIVPFGLLIGAGIVTAHRIFAHVRMRQPDLVDLLITDFIAVRSQSWQFPPQRNQLPAIHPVCGLHPVQPVTNMYPAQLDHCRILHAVLPAQLPTTHLQGLLVPHRRRLRWRKSHVLVHSFVCCLWRGRTRQAFSSMVGK